MEYTISALAKLSGVSSRTLIRSSCYNRNAPTQLVTVSTGDRKSIAYSRFYILSLLGCH